jgi:hypothetical protein
MRPSGVRTALLVLLGSTSGACATDPTGAVPTALSLSAAERRWHDAAMANYSYVGVIGCFCLDEYVGPLRATVRQGRVTEVVDVQTGAARPLTFRKPIDSLFAMVRTEISVRPERLRITFDKRLGYPSSLTYGTPENDGGGTITVSEVSRLP